MANDATQSDQNNSQSPSTSAEEGKYPIGAWIALAILTLVYALNIADRYVFSTLLENVKHDFQLSDAAVGFLTGVAVAIFYSVLGIPLGALADRVNRKKLVALSVAAWSVMTALCGLSTTLWQLGASRIGVGIGEAGASPASYSLVADKFRPKMRPLALSILGTGATIGAWLGASGAGYLNDLYGWRHVLVIFGLGGLPLAICVWLIREPNRGTFDSPKANTESASSVRDTFAYIWNHKALFHIIAGATALCFWGWGIIWWIPAYLQRTFHITTGEAGSILGPVHGVGGTLAMIATVGVMAWLKNKKEHHIPMFVALVTLITTVASIFLFTTHNLTHATVLLWVFTPAIYIFIGPTTALIQNLTPPGMRATASGVYLFTSNFICLAVAPLIIGFMSDWLNEHTVHGQQSLRVALLWFAFTGFWAVYHYASAVRCMKHPATTKPSYREALIPQVLPKK